MQDVNNPNNSESLLYLISWEGTQDIVKIGRTTNFAKRSNAFLTAHPDPLLVRCLCSENIMSEADLHARHQSARITLEHFHLTQGIQETIDMLNSCTKFQPYTIPRTLTQSGLQEDSQNVECLKQNISIPPIRISPAELRVAQLTAIGATVAESAEAIGISESAVKSHRASIVQKCFTPNLPSAISKLMVHNILDPTDLTND